MKSFVSEALGTFALVLVGTGSIVINDSSGGVISHIGIAINFGLVVMAMIYALGDVSGAHINPAVTLAFWIDKKIPSQTTIGYIIFQLLGAFGASIFLMWLYPQHPNLGATLPSIAVFQAFVFEIILTFLLMLVIIQVATGSKEKGLMAGAAIGATVCLEAMFAGPATGASMNPARSIAPAIVSGNVSSLWLYVIGPTIGSITAVFVCKYLKSGNRV